MKGKRDDTGRGGVRGGSGVCEKRQKRAEILVRLQTVGRNKCKGSGTNRCLSGTRDLSLLGLKVRPEVVVYPFSGTPDRIKVKGVETLPLPTSLLTESNNVTTILILLYYRQFTVYEHNSVD